MSSPQPHDPLSDTLQTWRVQPPANPNFRPAVWQRVQARRETWASYVRAHRRSVAVATLALLLVGGWTGRAAAQAKLAAERDAMVVTYLVGLDPRVQAKLR